MDLKHWKYFLLIEDDFIRTTGYVELTPSNYNTYSIEFTKIIFTACSEIDVLCKHLCSLLGDNKANDIRKYGACISNKYKGLPTVTIDVTPEITLIPWDKWLVDLTPDWWRDYNSIKHERTLNFDKSNLKTTLECIGGLMIINLYYYKTLYNDIPQESPKLFDDKFFPSIMTTEGGDKYLPDFH